MLSYQGRVDFGKRTQRSLTPSQWRNINRNMATIMNLPRLDSVFGRKRVRLQVIHDNN